MKSILILLGISIGASCFGQMTQEDIAGKYDPSTSAGEYFGFYYQSIDGSRTCSGSIAVEKSDDKLTKITLDLSKCDGVFDSFSGTYEFTNIIQTDRTYTFAENQEASTRFKYSDGIYYLERLIPRNPGSFKRWNFVYDMDFAVNESDLSASNHTETEQESSNKYEEESSEDYTEEESPETDVEETDYTEADDYSAEETEVYVQESDGSGEYKRYRIQKGEYIWQIARDLGCNPFQILRINKLSSEETLFPGQQILVCENAKVNDNTMIARDRGYTPKSKTTGSTGSTSSQTQALIDELKKENFSLTEFNKDIKAEYDLLSKEYAKLQKDYKSVKEENVSLKAFAEEMKKDYAEIVAVYEELKRAYEDLTVQYKEMQRRLARMQKGGASSGGASASGYQDEGVPGMDAKEADEMASKLSEMREHLSEVRSELSEARKANKELQGMMNESESSSSMQEEIQEANRGGGEESSSMDSESGSQEGSQSGSSEAGTMGGENQIDEEMSDDYTSAAINNQSITKEAPKVELRNNAQFEKLGQSELNDYALESNESKMFVEDLIKLELNELGGVEAIYDASGQKLLPGQASSYVDKLRGFQFNAVTGGFEAKPNIQVVYKGELNKVSYEVVMKRKKPMVYDKSGNEVELTEDHAHMQLIDAKLKSRGIKKGKYDVKIVEGVFSLEQNIKGDSKKLSSFDNTIIDRFDAL